MTKEEEKLFLKIIELKLEKSHLEGENKILKEQNINLFKNLNSNVSNNYHNNEKILVEIQKLIDKHSILKTHQVTFKALMQIKNFIIKLG